jgi:hypothetical protein
VDDSDRPQPTVSASEVGRYVFCARAWWLQRGCGLAPRNLGALEQGLRRHAAHGHLVAHAQRQRLWARWLLVLAALLAVGLIIALLQR